MRHLIKLVVRPQFSCLCMAPNAIGKIAAKLKRFFLGRKPIVYPGDEFNVFDLLVEIGSCDKLVVDDTTMNGYSLAFKGQYEDFQYGRGLPYYVFNVSKATAHANYVKVGYWDNKRDVFVDSKE